MVSLHAVDPLFFAPALWCDSALFSRPATMWALTSYLGRIASSHQIQATTNCAGRVLLALVPFSALAWMFVAR